MVRRFAAVIVENDRPTEELRDQYRRERRQEERRVRGGKYVDDVGVPQLAEKQGPVANLGDDGAEVFDAQGRRKRQWRDGINRDQPRPDPLVALPGIEQSLRLHRLSAQNPE